MLLRPLIVLALALSAAACDRAGEPRASAEQATHSPTTQAAMSQDKEEKFVLGDEEWRKRLSPEEYHVLRQKGTERAFTGKYTDHSEPGTYHCRACGAELFHAAHKFHSGCGWPAFYTAMAGERVRLEVDRSYGMIRTEVLCARCDSHLGHVFEDAPDQPTGQRYCINSVALDFVPDQPAGGRTEP